MVVESQAGRAVNASQKSSDPSASSDISGPSDDEGGKDQCVLQIALQLLSSDRGFYAKLVLDYMLQLCPLS